MTGSTDINDLADRARALLDAYPEDVFPPLPQDWTAGMVTGQVPDASDEDGYEDVWITSDRFAAHVIRRVALPVIADLLTERDAAIAELHEAWMERSDTEAERDAAIARANAAEADRDRLLNAIGNPWELRELGLVPSTIGVLRRIADAVANTTTHPTGDTDD